MANIIVTGSSRGIGFELARLLADEGHQVLALSRNEMPISRLKHQNIASFSFDLSNTADLDKLDDFLKSWETVDVLINNAGRLLNKPFLETTSSEFEEVYKVNVFGVASMTKAVLPKMSKNGHVVTISSMGGVQGSMKFPGLSAYSSSFNVLALGAVQTEMLEEAFPGYEAPITAIEMAAYIKGFALTGQKIYNGKLLQVSSSTP